MSLCFYILKKTATTCVVLGDKYIDGNFGCGSVGIKFVDIQWICHNTTNLMCWMNLQ